MSTEQTIPSEGGGWAVAYRIKNTTQAAFHDDAIDVDEATARKTFGRCIYAGETDQTVDGCLVGAVRLLKVKGRGATGIPLGWEVIDQHEIGSVERWKADADAGLESMPPYLAETVPLGVPCLPGAWGGSGCAMHSGYDIDENGHCVEGWRMMKVLDIANMTNEQGKEPPLRKGES